MAILETKANLKWYHRALARLGVALGQLAADVEAIPHGVSYSGKFRSKPGFHCPSSTEIGKNAR
jgi:hypothetical protein